MNTHIRRRRTLTGICAGVLVAALVATVAVAYSFPSTNAANRAADHPYVMKWKRTPGTVRLKFVNNTNSQAYFEYRIDGKKVGAVPHPVVDGSVIYPGVCVDGRADPICSPGPVYRTFKAKKTVEVRLALGGERDWDFNWTTFKVGPKKPVYRSDCRRGSWRAYGFSSLAKCYTYVRNN
jgi:hypothetical protein